MMQDPCRRKLDRDLVDAEPSDLAVDIPAWAKQQQGDTGHSKAKPESRKGAAALVAGPATRNLQIPTPLLTIGEVAAVFRISPKTVRRMIGRGKLGVVRIGRSVRIRKEQVERLISGNQSQQQSSEE